MKVYLKKDVPNVGKAHEVHEVSAGYARNYLLPHGLAIAATPTQVKLAQDHQKSQQARLQRIQAKSQQLAARIAGKPLNFRVKAGDKGRLYGSITSGDIAEALEKSLGESFDKRTIVLDRPLRELGIHSIALKLPGGVQGQVQVMVEAEAE